jgi:hypothetical protein
MGMRSCIAVGLLFPARSDVISAPAAAMGRAIVPTSRLLPALCFVLFSIAISAAANSPQSPVDLTKGATFTFKIHSKLPQFTFKILPTFYGKDEYGNGQPVMRGIGVFRGNSKVPQQYRVVTHPTWTGRLRGSIGFTQPTTISTATWTSIS